MAMDEVKMTIILDNLSRLVPIKASRAIVDHRLLTRIADVMLLPTDRDETSNLSVNGDCLLLV